MCPSSAIDHQVSATRVVLSIGILLVLIFSKFFYTVSLTNYYTFFLIDTFHVPELGDRSPGVRHSCRALDWHPAGPDLLEVLSHAQSDQLLHILPDRQIPCARARRSITRCPPLVSCSRLASCWS